MGAYKDHLVEVSKDVLKYIKSKKEVSFEESKLFESYLSNLSVAQAFAKHTDSNGMDIYIPVTDKYRGKYYLVAFTMMETEVDDERNFIFKKMKLKDMCDDLALKSNVAGIIINPCGLNFIVNRDLMFEIYSNSNY